MQGFREIGNDVENQGETVACPPKGQGLAHYNFDTNLPLKPTGESPERSLPLLQPQPNKPNNYCND